MSEQLSHVPKQETLAAPDNKEALQKHLDAMRERADADNEAHQDDDNLEAIKNSVEASAVSKEDYNTSESSADAAPAPTHVSSELKEMGRRRILNNARRHMSAPSKVFSKVIHQGAVEKISEAAAPTIARPSGILGGGLFALIGSSILLYAAKHYGYQYNYFVFILLFVGGFALGMIVELVIRALLHGRKKV